MVSPDDTPGPSTESSTGKQRSLLRKYALPVLVGASLGVGALFLLSRFAPPHGPLTQSPETPRLAGDAPPALLGDNPGVIVTVPEPRKPLPEPAEGEDGQGVAPGSPPPCVDEVENVDCLLATLETEWQVVVATDSPSGVGAPTVQAPVGGRLRWPAISERGGIVTSFVVEADGSVLLIYPSPAGNSAEARAGVQFDVPSRLDKVGMKWNRPGTRRVFVLVSTVPFVAPEGLAAGRVATFYGAGDAAESFFRSLRKQVHADQTTGEGNWALGEAVFEVVAGS